jgi:hypothetical protein
VPVHSLTRFQNAWADAGDPGAYAFCRALNENSTLIELNLSNNHVSPQMAASVQVLSECRLRLYLRVNQLLAGESATAMSLAVCQQCACF